MKKEYWIIDTDPSEQVSNTRHAVGPYPTRKAAETAALNDIRDVWNDSCTCLKTAGYEADWCAPLLIVEVIRKVIPKITAKIELVDA
jgi:hypothetical protein